MRNEQLEEVLSVRTPLLSLLTSVLWADGRMAHTQVRALDQVARVLSADDVAGRIVRGPRPYDASMFTNLGPASRRLLYALAVWVALADRRVHRRERELLLALASGLDLDPIAVHDIQSLVREVLCDEGVTADGLSRVTAALSEDVSRVA